MSIKLTQYSHGAGCGCKLSPAVLDKILTPKQLETYPKLLVGNAEKDDAAVYDLGDGTAIISTTDFFMPICDDPYDFGRIAATNAISDIYAMGGTPLLAIAILGLPVDKLEPEVAAQMVAGGQAVCSEAGIPLAGGHSIDCPEPIFGLAVTGRVAIAQLKKNGGAKVGAKLYLTKPLGVGILTTAQKKGKLEDLHAHLAIQSMTTLNKIGAEFGALPYIQSMTDVTGFGLLGHLIETCEAGKVSASIYFSQVPLLDEAALQFYLAEKCIPGGTNRNWASYGHKVGAVSEYQRSILADPQTSGGLLVAIEAAHCQDFEEFCKTKNLNLKPIGEIIEQQEKVIQIEG